MSADLFLWPVDDGERPTVSEVQLALTRLKGFAITCDRPNVGEFWHVAIQATNNDSQYAYISVQFRDDGTDCNICFETGDTTTIAYIASVLATITGPMALYHPSEPEPLITLFPNMTYDEVREALDNTI